MGGCVLVAREVVREEVDMNCDVWTQQVTDSANANRGAIVDVDADGLDPFRLYFDHSGTKAGRKRF